MVNFTHHNDIILTWVEPKGGVVTAWPNQIAIIMRDGKVTDVFTEGTRPVRPSLLSRSKVQAFIAYTAPFSLTFRLEDEYGLSDWDDGIPLKGVVLTADGHTVTAQLVITFSVTPDKVDLLLRLSPTGRPIKAADVADAIKGELLAKVLTLDIRDYTAADLRGNETLLRSLYDSLRRELHSTLSGYGLQLDNFYANWGLTTPEDARLGEYQHQQHLREIERQQELQSKARQDEERREAQQRLDEARAREEERTREDRLRLEETRVREETRLREERLRLEEARVREDTLLREKIRLEEILRLRDYEKVPEEDFQEEQAQPERPVHQPSPLGYEDMELRRELAHQLVADLKSQGYSATELTVGEAIEVKGDSSTTPYVILTKPSSNILYQIFLSPSGITVSLITDVAINYLLEQHYDTIISEIGGLVWTRSRKDQVVGVYNFTETCHPSIETPQQWVLRHFLTFKDVFDTYLEKLEDPFLNPAWQSDATLSYAYFIRNLSTRLSREGGYWQLDEVTPDFQHIVFSINTWPLLTCAVGLEYGETTLRFIVDMGDERENGVLYESLRTKLQHRILDLDFEMSDDSRLHFTPIIPTLSGKYIGSGIGVLAQVHSQISPWIDSGIAIGMYLYIYAVSANLIERLASVGIVAEYDGNVNRLKVSLNNWNGYVMTIAWQRSRVSYISYEWDDKAAEVADAVASHIESVEALIGKQEWSHGEDGEHSISAVLRPTNLFGEPSTRWSVEELMFGDPSVRQSVEDWLFNTLCAFKKVFDSPILAGLAFQEQQSESKRMAVE